MRKRLGVCVLLALCALPAPAYYHFIQYLNGAAIREKFDLRSLPNSTVTIFVSENGPQQYTPTDTFNSVLAQIRQAAQVWNGIGTSSLRVAFGGLENIATLQNTPGGDVVFEDLPPGLYGYGGPSSTLTPVTAADGSVFIPIARSTVHLNRNMTVLPGPSFNETFFMVAVHELGHALGLQHTFTSSTMSQATTRATNLTHPVDNDDIAGLSVLYPTAAFAQFGSISGQITVAGNGVHLASVVAIRSGSNQAVGVGNGAVSGVTNPDGTFRIDGIPPGGYYLYVHTMPPDANIYGPWNADGSLAAPSGPVNTLFYPGTTDPTQAAVVQVQPSQVTAGINIATTARSAITLYDDVIYGFLNNNPVQPAFVDMLTVPAPAIVASGFGLGANGQAPGLGVQVIGGAVTIPATGIQPYQSGGYTYVALYPSIVPGAPTGPQHVVFSVPGDMYVLPSGINLTVQPPPTVSGATGNGDGTVTVTGTGWAPDTRLYFDALPSTIISMNAATGTAVVQPPAGANGQQATLTAYNSDGQNSEYVQPTNPVIYPYGTLPAPTITSISPASLPAGAEALIDIVGSGFAFTPGQVAIGFGTTDVFVQNIFVLSPNHLQVDVLVSASATLSNPDVSIFSGFRIATAPAGFRIMPPVPDLPAPIPTLTNAGAGLTGAYPGAVVTVYGQNLANAGVTPVVTINAQQVNVLYASATQLNLQLPATLTPGLATLTLNNGTASGFPLIVNIAALPATIAAVQYSNGAAINAANPGMPGNLILVSLTNFAASGASINPSQVQVSVAGVSHPAAQVSQAGSTWQVGFDLTASDAAGPAQPLIVYVNGQSSYPATIAVAAGAASN